MPGPQREKRSSGVLDQLAIAASKMFYEEGLSPAEIARKLRKEGVRNERDARNMLQRARKRGLAQVKVESRVTAPLDEDLGHGLERISGIRTVLVARTRLADSSEDLISTDPGKRRQAVADSDALHRQLGDIAGDFLWNRLRPDDCIAVGGGRATGFTVRALESKKEAEGRTPSFGRPRVISLAAGLLMSPWEAAPVVDADLVAIDLANVVGADARLAQLPIALEPPNEEVVKSVAPHLLGEVWENQRPDIALFGLGIPNPHYYIMRSPRRAPGLNEDFQRLQEQVLSQYPSAVADVCHYCWVVDEAIADDKTRSRARQLVESINAKTIHISLTKVDQAREKILIAGGAPKHPAVLALLTRPDDIGLHVTVLVTDEVTAQYLIEEIPRRAR